MLPCPRPPRSCCLARLALPSSHRRLDLVAVFGLPRCCPPPLPPVPCCRLRAISLAVSSCASSACVPMPSPCPLPCPSVSVSLAVSLRLSLSPPLVRLAPLLLLPLPPSPPRWPRRVRAHRPHLPDPFLAVSPSLPGARGCAPLPSPSPSPSRCLLLAALGVHCAHLHQPPQPIHLPSLALSRPPAVSPFRRGYGCTPRLSPPCCQVRAGARPCRHRPPPPPAVSSSPP